MRKIKTYFEQIRKPSKKLSYKSQIVITLGVILLGFLLGTLQKWIDGTGGSNLPLILQQLDIGNYFGRLAIWILLGSIISVYSESPVRAGINTFVFFISMLAGYYLYCNFVLGFLPKAYMMMWLLFAFASFFMAYFCWHAKGEGIIAILISSVIIGVLLAIFLFGMVDLYNYLTIGKEILLHYEEVNVIKDLVNSSLTQGILKVIIGLIPILIVVFRGMKTDNQGE